MEVAHVQLRPVHRGPQTRRLLRAGEEVPLSPKAFDLLIILIENRARAMSRTELHQQLWPSTFVVDTNLASRVAEIRRALADTAKDPLYVRTLHRFGYWLVPVSAETPSSRRWCASAAFSAGWSGKRGRSSWCRENVIGRAPDADVWIDAPGVSRNHARITLSNQQAALEDLASKNGTFVGGERITTACRLSDGDQIRLGSVVATFRTPSDGRSTETSLPRD